MMLGTRGPFLTDYNMGGGSTVVADPRRAPAMRPMAAPARLRSRAPRPGLDLNMADLADGAALEAAAFDSTAPEPLVPEMIQGEPMAPSTAVADMVARTPTPRMKGPGFFDRVGDWLHAPGNAAALFRSGIGTLRGGLGEGLAAGAGYADQRRAEEAAAAQAQQQNLFKALAIAIDQQQADQSGDYQRGQLNLGYGNLNENRNARVAQNTLTARAQDVQVRGQNIGLQDNREGRQVQRYGIDVGSADRRYSEDQGNFVAMRGQNMSSDTSRYVADRGAQSREDVAETRIAAGIGSKSAPANIQKQALPVPDNIEAMQVGKYYRTPNGIVQWDGQRGVPVR